MKIKEKKMQNMGIGNADSLELVNVPEVNVGVTFEELQDKARGIQELCRDYYVNNVSGMNMRLTEDCNTLMYLPEEQTPVSSPLTRFAMSQLCGKMGVPVRYFDKCVEEGMTELASENMNAWIEAFGKNLFIRTYNSTIRGVLSDRYMTLDTPEIMDILADVVDLNEYSVKGYHLSSERLHLRMVHNEMLNVQGEDLFAGVQIDSSDVGRSTLTARFFIYKQVCTNGLCVAKGEGILFEQKHVGISAEDFRTNLRESLERIPLLVSNAVAFIEEARARNDKYNIARLSSAELETFHSKLKTTTRLSDEAVKKVVSILQEKYTPTKWGLINAVTEVAQDYTLERRIDLEKIAGDMLYSNLMS
ncbi:MAG: DUF932 domain-containing protein [Bacteroidales bacterium]